ncbi:MAG: DNA-directed RNA polymerase subunit alpha C-terminal domain-containing protein [Planctomycetota bacterium]
MTKKTPAAVDKPLSADRIIALLCYKLKRENLMAGKELEALEEKFDAAQEIADVCRFRRDVLFSKRLRDGFRVNVRDWDANERSAAVRRAIALWACGAPTEAVAAFKEAKSQDHKGLFFAALAALEDGDGPTAVPWLKILYGHDGGNLEYTLAYAKALRLAGDVATALPLLEKLRKTVRDDARVRTELGLCMGYEGRHDEAHEELSGAVQLDPGDGDAHFHLASWYDARGEEDLALIHYEKAANLPTSRVNSLLHLSIMYEDHGQYNKAAACCRRVLNEFPAHPRAQLFMKDIRSSKTMYYDEDAMREVDRRAKILDIPISDFELSVRSRNCLAKMKVRTLGDLIKKTEDEILSYKNFGETSLSEIKNILQPYGLDLGQAEGATPVAPAPAEPAPEVVLDQPIAILELSVRGRRCIEKLKVVTIRDLTERKESDLLKCRNFGANSLDEIREKLAVHGLALAPEA